MSPSLPPRISRREMPTVWCRFYGPLNELLPEALRQRAIPWRSSLPEPVKSVIEGLGGPHVEVAMILVNGQSVGWEHRLEHGDRVSAFPPFMSLAVGPTPVWLAREPDRRFVLDVHLGTLARWLRLLGVDAAYCNACDDETLARVAHDEARILLTHDRRLLMRNMVERGHWVRAHDTRAQLVEIVQRYDLLPVVRPCTRCARCNGLLEPVSLEQIAHRLEPETARRYRTFSRCALCGQVYWAGSHLRRIEQMLAHLYALDAGGEPRGDPSQRLWRVA